MNGTPRPLSGPLTRTAPLPSDGGGTRPRLGFPKDARLLKRRQFLAVTDRSAPPDLKIPAGCFLLVGRVNGEGRHRLGVTVTTKTAPRAVDRNRIKRLVREFFRTNRHKWPGAYDLVFIARREAQGADRQKLAADLARLGRKLSALERKGQPPQGPPEAPAEEGRFKVSGGGCSGPEKALASGPAEIWRAGLDFFEWFFKGLALGVIRLYQILVSPLFPPCCRFKPTCSRYAIQALTAHGFWRGSILAARRILKCHPFHPGGYDPVPPPKTETGAGSAPLTPPFNAPDI